MVDLEEKHRLGEEEDAALQKEHSAWMKRLKLKAQLWDELRDLAIKRGLVEDGVPHRKLRKQLVMALGEFEELDRGSENFA